MPEPNATPTFPKCSNCGAMTAYGCDECGPDSVVEIRKADLLAMIEKPAAAPPSAPPDVDRTGLLKQALAGFEDAPTVEEYVAEFAGQPSPSAGIDAPPDVAMLADEEVPKWLDEDERCDWEYASPYLDGRPHRAGHYKAVECRDTATRLRIIASLRASLARAAEERDEARREARELRDALRELYNVFPVVPIHDVDRHARIANAMDKARRLLGGEGA